MDIAQRYQKINKSVFKNRQSISMSDKAQKAVIKDDNVIINFLEQKDVPAWFRGSSEFQLEAANNLFNAIRDDKEQSTSHRVRACLTSIGLDPLPSPRDIKLLMRLSKGNDLAFLWFLMEMYYLSPKVGEHASYNVNEQLIMSSIAHLDMWTTLKELDRILPPGEKSVAFKAAKRREERRKAELERNKLLMDKIRKCQTNRKRKYPVKLPYFEDLPRPKHYGKSLTIPVPDFRVNFGCYEEHNDPHLVIHNELNRWYANYQLQPGKRIANGIINEQITNILENFDAASLKAETVNVLCNNHKALQEMEELLEAQLRVAAKEKCLSHLDVGKRDREERNKKLMRDLENDIQAYICRFRKLAQRNRREHVVLMLGNDVDCKILEDLPDESDDCKNPKKTEDADKDFMSCARENVPPEDSCQAITLEGGNIFDSQLKHKPDLRKPGNECMVRNDNLEPKVGVGNQDGRKASCASNSVTIQSTKPESNDGENNPNFRNSHMCNFSCEYMKNYDYGHTDKPTPKASQTYFNAPQPHRPYSFDFRKIFHYKDNNPTNINVKRAFVEALESDIERLSKLEDLAPNTEQAVSNAAKDIWKEQVALANEKLDKLEEINQRKKAEHALDYDYDAIYDGDDKDFMKQLLFDAFTYMSKNPKFVLASMPHAYKLPMILEFVYRRYGKLYTRKERYKSFRLSLKIFRALDKITLQVPMPSTKEMGKQMFVKYSCRDYLMKKANLIKQRYYNKLDSAIMEQARVFWFAMRPYLCSNGPPRNTYYAYMPSRVADITRFRLWKSTEFMNAKSEWERRQIKRANQNLF